MAESRSDSVNYLLNGAAALRPGPKGCSIGDYKHKFAMMQNAPQVDSDGYIHVPQGPGLGVEIDPDMIEG